MDAMERDPINLNTASAKDLREGLPGIEMDTAERIVAYREAHGHFGSLTDLSSVDGVSLGWLEEHGRLLTLGEPDYHGVELIPTLGTATDDSEAALDDLEAAVAGLEGRVEEQLDAAETAAEDVVSGAVEAAIASEGTLLDAEQSDNALPEERAETVPVTLEEASEFVDAQPPVEEPQNAEALLVEPLVQEPAIEEPQIAEPLIIEPLVEEPRIGEPVLEETAAEQVPEHEPVIVEEAPWGETGGLAERADVLVDEAPTVVRDDLGALSDELPDLAAAMQQSDELEAPTMADSGPAVAVAGARTAGADQERATSERAVTAGERTQTRAGLGFWRSALLVLLGALGGTLLTLAVLGLLSGSLNFTPRREYDALNRNVDTMQRNQELTWDRVDDAAARADTVQRELERLSTLEGRLASIEGSVSATDEALAGLMSDAAALAGIVRSSIETVDDLAGRVEGAEDSLSAVRLSLEKVDKGVDALQGRVARFDAFFGALRDLLADMEPGAEPPTAEQPATAE